MPEEGPKVIYKRKALKNSAINIVMVILESHSSVCLALPLITIIEVKEVENTSFNYRNSQSPSTAEFPLECSMIVKHAIYFDYNCMTRNLRSLFIRSTVIQELEMLPNSAQIVPGKPYILCRIQKISTSDFSFLPFYFNQG
jgi:hypothetical protein